MNPIWQNWQFIVKPLWSVDLITTVSRSPSTRLLYNKGAKPPARKTVNSRQLSLWWKEKRKKRRLPCLLFLAIPIQDIPFRSHLSAFLIAVPQPRTASGYRMERQSYGRSHKELVKAPASAAYSLTCFRVNHLVLSKRLGMACLHALSTKPSLTLCVFLKAQEKNKLKIIARFFFIFNFTRKSTARHRLIICRWKRSVVMSGQPEVRPILDTVHRSHVCPINARHREGGLSVNWGQQFLKGVLDPLNVGLLQSSSLFWRLSWDQVGGGKKKLSPYKTRETWPLKYAVGFIKKIIVIIQKPKTNQIQKFDFSRR